MMVMRKEQGRLSTASNLPSLRAVDALGKELVIVAFSHRDKSSTYHIYNSTYIGLIDEMIYTK